MVKVLLFELRRKRKVSLRGVKENEKADVKCRFVLG